MRELIIGTLVVSVIILTSCKSGNESKKADDGSAINNDPTVMTSLFSADQEKLLDKEKDVLKENAEYIGKSDKIDHQREHFYMMSEDIYELVKGFDAEKVLCQVYFPMYNDNKEAIWISETKDIKNPYLGAKMPACGSVKEVIK